MPEFSMVNSPTHLLGRMLVDATQSSLNFFFANKKEKMTQLSTPQNPFLCLQSPGVPRAWPTVHGCGFLQAENGATTGCTP